MLDSITAVIMQTATTLKEGLAVNVKLDLSEKASTVLVRTSQLSLTFHTHCGFYTFSTDVDECHTNPCDTNADCSDIIGGFECTCRSGYTGNGTHCQGKLVLLQGSTGI